MDLNFFTFPTAVAAVAGDGTMSKIGRPVTDIWSSRRPWLLLSDIHFKHPDLDRITRTADWITTLPSRYNVQRIVVCGDLLTTRSSQPTHVLDACYRFVNRLSECVPRINILLGNHDLAYKRDYHTTALSALGATRLSPFVTVHSDITHDEWDGRRVLLLPFREEQDELLHAVHALSPTHANDTVAFAHLAIHKAITQRYVVSDAGNKRRPPVTYRGLTGRAGFAPLAHTFTGHFHSHQTLWQDSESDDLRGSITYLGSPLQLTWADLHDTQRGVLLFDPVTLDFELVPNPHAVGYVSAEITNVMRNEAIRAEVADKHVMLLGELTSFKYLAARDKLLASGARSVRSWRPLQPNVNAQFAGLGTTAPASDASVVSEEMSLQDTSESGRLQEQEGPSKAATRVRQHLTAVEMRPLDFPQLIKQYVEALELEPSLQSRVEDIKRIGLFLVRLSTPGAGQGTPEISNYKELFEENVLRNVSSSFHEATPKTIFVSKPRAITITNFLGVQGTLRFEIGNELPHGLTFLVGDNGSGKSTLIEAFVWCQFGRCIRAGMTVNDVVNEKMKKDCCVSMELENGYTITRYRKDKTNGNRVVVTLNGKEMPQYEQPDARSTQTAIDELLGTTYENFVRTVVLSHESAAGFLSSTSSQRRELFETMLDLSILDDCSELARKWAKDVDADTLDVKGKLQGTEDIMRHIMERIDSHTATISRLEVEIKDIGTALESFQKLQAERQHTHRNEDLISKLNQRQTALEEEIEESQRQISELAKLSKMANIRAAVDEQLARLHSQADTFSDRALRNRQALPRLKHQLSVVKKGMGMPFSARIIRVLRRTLRTAVKRLRQATRTEDTEEASQPTTMFSFRANFLRPLFKKFRTVVEELKALEQDILQRSHQYSSAVQEIQTEIKRVQREIEKNSMSVSSARGEIDGVQATMARRLDIPLEMVCEAVNTLTAVEAQAIPRELSNASQLQARLQRQYTNLLRSKRAEEKERMAQEQALQSKHMDLSAQLLQKKSQLETYTRILAQEKVEIASLKEKKEEYSAAASVIEERSALLKFWVSSFAVRKSSTPTFRGLVLETRLKELNALAVQIVGTLYEDSRHVRDMTTGMLQSVFGDDDGEFDLSGTPRRTDKENSRSKQVGLVDSSLSVDASLAYGKRSSGERKRIDLAIFFALLQLGQANCAHRAHYMLVDEVFDSLDAAGRRSVLRWCEDLAGNLDFVLVITHSEHLVKQAVVAAEEGEGSHVKRSVVSVRMTDAGVTFQTEGVENGV